MEKGKKQLAKNKMQKSSLISILKNKDVKGVINFEKGLTMRKCIESQALIMYEDVEFIGAALTFLCERYMTLCFPEQNTEIISIQFANDLLELRPTWSISDCVNFFKFIRQRQDLAEVRIFGNKITLLKLIELTGVYENHRAIEWENYLNETKPKQISERQTTHRGEGIKNIKEAYVGERYFEKKK